MREWRNMLAAGTRAVALDFGADATRLLVLGGSGGWRRTAACTLPRLEPGRAAPASLVQALTERVREHGLRGAACRITIASDAFRTELTQLPAMNDEELRASARFEALDRFGVEESDVVIHHAALDAASTDRRSVMLFAVPQTTVRQAAALAMDAGLTPSSVEHAGLAALRGIERWQGESQLGLVACLQIEARVATLMLLRDGNLVQMRCMQGDWQVAAGAPSRPTPAPDADSIPLDPVDAVSPWRWSCLAEETLRCLRHATGDSAWPARMLVTGPAAGDASLLDALLGVCGLTVQPAASDRWVDGTPNLSGEDWASALGAASIDMKSANLRRAA